MRAECLSLVEGFPRRRLSSRSASTADPQSELLSLDCLAAAGSCLKERAEAEGADRSAAEAA